MAAIITRTRRLPDDELPKVLSDADLLAWGQSLVDVHVDDWTPDPGASDEEAEEAVAAVAAHDVDAEAPEVAAAPEIATAVEAEAAEVGDVTVEAEAEPAPAAEVSVVAVEADADADAVTDRPAAAEAGLTVEQVEVVAEAEPAAPAKPARISRRRRELVALRQHLAAQAAEGKQATQVIPPRPATRREPLHGYRPDPLGGSGTATAWSHASEVRTRLQERLAKVTPVARAHEGQWAAHDDAPRAVAASEQAAAVIRVRLADAD